MITSATFCDIILCYGFVCSCADSQDRQDRANKTLVNVKAGIEHLANKLQHLKAVRTHIPANVLPLVLHSEKDKKP